MSKNRILLVAFLMAGLATMAVAQTFSVDLYLENASAKSLTFGMGAARELAGVPPFQAPANLNVVWLEGPGDVTDAKIDEDFSKLSTYIKKSADAGMWKLYVRNGMKITFKSTNIPNRAYLKLYAEGDEDNAIDIVNDTVFNAAADTTYLIDFRTAASTAAALPSPSVKHVQMSSSNTTLDVHFDVEDGYTLAVEPKATVYTSVEDGDYVVYEETTTATGTVALADSSTATLTMTSMENVARIQFEYLFATETASTEKAVVIVEVTKGLTTSLVKKQDAASSALIAGAVVAVDPSAEGYDGTILTYKIDFDEASVGGELTLTVDTPKFAPDAAPYTVGYYFTDTEDGEGEFSELPADPYSVTASSIYLKVKATLTDKCEPGYVAPTIAIGENAVDLEAVQFILVSGGTMDVDGNGVITEDDAIMMYNFIALGGIDDPESMFIDDIIQGIDETQVNAEAALATLKSLAAFLDYDENGVITEDDAIMMYNFIALGGIDDPESMFVDDIIQGIDATQVNAEKALENFKKYASK